MDALVWQNAQALQGGQISIKIYQTSQCDNCWEYLCSGLQSHPEESRNTPSDLMLQKPGKAPAWLTSLRMCGLNLAYPLHCMLRRRRPV